MSRPREVAAPPSPSPWARPARLAVSLLAGLAAVAGIAAASASIALDLDARLERSIDAFVGEVRSLRLEAFADEPWTVVTFEVERWLRSDGREVDEPAAELSRRGSVELAFLGGEAPGVGRRTVAGMPALEPGERVLVLSYGAGVRYASGIVGYDQGLFRLVDDAWTDADGAVLGLDDDGILTLGSDATPAGPAVLDALALRLEQVGAGP